MVTLRFTKSKVSINVHLWDIFNIVELYLSITMWLETLHYIQWNKCFIENLLGKKKVFSFSFLFCLMHVDSAVNKEDSLM